MEKQAKSKRSRTNDKPEEPASGAVGDAQPADNPKYQPWSFARRHDEIRKLFNEDSLFAKFYRDINPAAPGEWDEFWESLKNPLPTTFWVNDTDDLAPSVVSFMQSMGALSVAAASSDGASASDPAASPSSTSFRVETIDWYPHSGMAWRITADKISFRKSPELQPLRRYLMKHTAMGTISRQEEVSMIPPLLLNIQPNDVCLDMCASPGSKTAQMLLELGRWKKRPAAAAAAAAAKVVVGDNDGNNDDDGGDGVSAAEGGARFPFDYLSAGCIVANELDTSRANMLVFQVKRLRQLFPFAVFTNHDARYFPQLTLTKVPTGDSSTPQTSVMKFDKILCDVVCSGDGTVRKAPFLVKRWSPLEAMTLQRVQIQIALRACHLLAVGGRMVYSTCSMNPIENEAVVSQIIKRTNGAMRLVDPRVSPSPMLPRLRSAPGMTHWQVMGCDGAIIERDNPGKVHEACFPLVDPPSDLDLRSCMRFTPKHCSGGSFFVAVFEKVAPWEFPTGDKRASGEDVEVQTATEQRAHAAAPVYLPVPQVIPDMLRDVYGAKGFPSENVFVRTTPGDTEVTLRGHTHCCFVSSAVRKILLALQESRWIVVAAGLRCLAAEHLTEGWRLTHEAAPIFDVCMRGVARSLNATTADVLQMLASGPLKDVRLDSFESKALHDLVAPLPMGSLILRVVPAPATNVGDAESYKKIPIIAFRARNRLQLFVDHEDVPELCCRLNIDAAPAAAKHMASGHACNEE